VSVADVARGKVLSRRHNCHDIVAVTVAIRDPRGRFSYPLLASTMAEGEKTKGYANRTQRSIQVLKF
jgi:hypothetical protein